MRDKILCFGDNLGILKEHVRKESIDLIYLDPPFNSQASYNILFKETSGEDSQAQIAAFDDTWHWTRETERAFREIVDTAPQQVVDVINAFSKFLHKKNDMFAYLTMMTIRLLELHRVLKPSGSLFLHCDPTASHYLKIVLDTIFSFNNFRNEIIWKRTTSHNDPVRFGRIHDVLLFYSKTEKPYWNTVYKKYEKSYVDTYYRYKDKDGRRFLSDNLTAPAHGSESGRYVWKGKKPSAGRMWAYTKKNMEKLEKEGKIFYTKNGFPRLKRYLKDMPGMPIQSIWSDILNIRSWHKEGLGYQTQKPRKLLERIIESSCPKDGLVLDPFCGCGTTISACEYLNQNKKYKLKWIGIDITHLAINLIKGRLRDEFKLEAGKDYKVIGEPKDVQGAKTLAEQNRFEFEWWALSEIDARPFQGKTKGADTGIDGQIYFIDPEKPKETSKAIVQVKSGKVQPKDIRELVAVIDREAATMGIFVTLKNPTKQMVNEAIRVGFYLKKYPKIQILTIKDILEGKRPEIPFKLSSIKKAEAVGGGEEENLSFFDQY